MNKRIIHIHKNKCLHKVESSFFYLPFISYGWYGHNEDVNVNENVINEKIDLFLIDEKT